MTVAPDQTPAPVADPLDWLEQACADRRRQGLHRVLRVRRAGDTGLDLASNDYLGLARHPHVVAAGVAALRAYGAGATGSRLVTGTTAVHDELETALAAFLGLPAALIFSSGYLANVGVVTALAGDDCLVVSDAANHASLIDACRLARSRTVVVRSGDVAAVSEALASRTEQRAVVVTDAVYSTTGALAPLRALHAVVRQHGAVLVVDEAHGLGVVGADGRGGCAQEGILGAPDVVVTATLSKALGSQGGVVLGSHLLREHLVDTARSFVFDTGLAPAAAAAALAALRLVTPARVDALRRNARALARGLGVAVSDSAVLPIVVGDPARASRARDLAAAEGVHVGCFRPPAVPVGGSCLRVTARADLSQVDVASATTTLLRSLAALD
ncbi:MAG: 8-amino-7-oxononanoate synthase [Frankiales bacterium]|nr:8-amino-7-oxononanoate synthase [Frankiales bacterium]